MLASNGGGQALSLLEEKILLPDIVTIMCFAKITISKG
jgi:hypothetical protein